MGEREEIQHAKRRGWMRAELRKRVEELEPESQFPPEDWQLLNVAIERLVTAMDDEEELRAELDDYAERIERAMGLLGDDRGFVKDQAKARQLVFEVLQGQGGE